LFDIKHNDLWLKGWGPKPESLDGRTQRLTELVAGAPRLIPVSAHRYLLIEPCVSGNRGLSIWKDDIIVHGQNLRSYFLAEFADLLGLDRRDNLPDADEESVRKVQSVPFWGELVAHNEES
jgi:hypothetical protein